MYYTKPLSVLALAGALLGAAMPVTADSIVVEWDRMIVEASLLKANTPPTCTHFMTVVNSCMYEAWSAYDPVAMGIMTGNSLDGLGGAATLENKQEAISHAAYKALMKLCPEMEADFRALMGAYGYHPDHTTPAALVGAKAAKAVLEYRKVDGSNWDNGYVDTTGYQPRDPSDPSAWQPLDMNGVSQTPIAPHWKFVVPFALESADQFRPPAPPEPGSAEWDQQIEEVLEYSEHLTNREKAILEWWLPPWGQPAQLQSEIMQSYSEQNGYSLDEDMKMFFVSHNAMLDAGIVAWEAKYHYEYVRPVTAIRALGAQLINAWGGPGQGTVQMPASEWLPYQALDFVTPPFPEYISGHSTFAGAWAEAMTLFKGEELDYTATVDHLEIQDVFLSDPVVLHYPTWWDAAWDSGISRLYGGIHWSIGNTEGLFAGQKAGAVVFERAMHLFTGTDHVSDLNMLNLAGPMGITNIGLMAGQTRTPGGMIDGLVGMDSRTNNSTIVGSEFGGWSITANDNGILSGLVDLTVTDSQGNVIDSNTIPVSGLTRYRAKGQLPGAVSYKNNIGIIGLEGRGSSRRGIKLVATQQFNAPLDDYSDLVSKPGTTPYDGRLIVLAGNLARTSENVELNLIAPEMGVFEGSNFDAARRRPSLFTGDTVLVTPDDQHATGSMIVRAVNRRDGVRSMTQARLGAMRAAATGSGGEAQSGTTQSGTTPQELAQNQRIEKLLFQTPAAATLIEFR